MPKPILIDFTDAQGTVESVLADTAVEAYDLIVDKLKHITAAHYKQGFTIKVSDGQAFSDNLDEDNGS